MSLGWCGDYVLLCIWISFDAFCCLRCGVDLLLVNYGLLVLLICDLVVVFVISVYRFNAWGGLFAYCWWLLTVLVSLIFICVKLLLNFFVVCGLWVICVSVF